MSAPPAYEAPPPAYGSDSCSASGGHAQAPTQEDKLEALKRASVKFDLAGGAVAKLRQLEKYDIVVIADDSGSMRGAAHAPPANDPFAKVPSRWDELKDRVKLIVELATCLDQDGIDIYFLNWAPVHGIHSVEQVDELFSRQPNGYTPLSRTYKTVLDETLGKNSEKNVLVIIATDGEPNKQERGKWWVDTDGFCELMKSRAGYPAHKCPTTIMACTDAEDEIGWLNRLDDDVPYCDVVDDFKAEQAEVLRAQGPHFPFKAGDYVVKTLLGSVDPLYDSLDEEPLNVDQYAQYLGCTTSEAKAAHKQANKQGGDCVVM